MLLILPPKFSAESNLIRKAAVDQNWEVERLQGWNFPQNGRGKLVAVYAEPLFVAKIEQDIGVKFPEPPDNWLVHLPMELCKRKIDFTTLAEARKLTTKAFVKPANFKTFKAGIFANGAALPDEEKVSGEEPVLISEVVNFASEFRFFMLNGQVIAGSVYFRDGETAEKEGQWPADANEYAAAAALAEKAYAASADLLPASVVIDTGYIAGKGWAVIEANPSWGSGLYGANPADVL